MGPSAEIENAPSAEVEKKPQDMTDFDVRALLENQMYLDPTKEIPNEESEVKVVSFEERDYTPFQLTSEYDRAFHWKVKAAKENEAGSTIDLNNYDVQLETWKKGIEVSLTKPSNAERMQKLSGIFQNAGIDVSQPITRAQVDAFHTYFFTPSADSTAQVGTKKFVAEVLTAYTTDGKVDLDKLRANKDSITWFAGIFGEPSADIVMSLVEAEAKLINDPEKIKSEVASHRTPPDRNISADERNLAYDYLKQLSLLPFERESVIFDVERIIEENGVSFIMGGTGSGKTTRLGVIILQKIMEKRKQAYIRDHGFEDPDDKSLVIESQPTQFTTENTGNAIAKLINGQVGEEVTWIHGDNKKNRDPKKEKIMLATERLALHMYQSILDASYSSKLDGLDKPDSSKLDELVGAAGTLYAIVDEIHMLNNDQILSINALLKLQERFGEKRIKIIFSSATADKEFFKKNLVFRGRQILSDKAILEVEGKAYKVTDMFQTREDQQKLSDYGRQINLRNPDTFRDPNRTREALAKDSTNKVLEIIRNATANKPQNQNTMVFLPGEREIRETQKRLEAEIKKINESAGREEYRVIAHYSTASKEEKDLIKQAKLSGIPKLIILTTDALKTGATILGITDVVLSGFQRQMILNTELGVNELTLTTLTKADLKQMAGRAGRTNPGRAHFLYISKDQHDSKNKDYGIQEHPIPEAERADVTSFVLDLYLQGETDIANFKLLARIPPEHLTIAINRLKLLHALNDDGSLNRPVAEGMSQYSVDLHNGLAIYEAKQKSLASAERVASIVCMLELTKDLFVALPATDADKDELAARRIRLVDGIKKAGVVDSDFMVLLEIWRIYDSINRSGQSKEQIRERKESFCSLYGFNISTMEKISERRLKILGRIYRGQSEEEIKKKTSSAEDDIGDQELIRRCFAVGYRDRILKKVTTGTPGIFMLHSPEDPSKLGPPIEYDQGNSKWIASMTRGADETYTLTAHLNTMYDKDVLHREVNTALFFQTMSDDLVNSL